MKSLYFFPILLLISLFTYTSCCHDNYDCNDSRCELDPDPGDCEAYIPKYYYDRADGTCKEFIWGGCDGVVPFNTLEECQICVCTN